MKLLILQNYIVNQKALDDGILLLKQQLSSINFPIQVTTQVITQQFSSTTSPNAQGISATYPTPSEIAPFLSGNDVVCLVYDWDRVSPKPTNPTDVGNVISLPCQWFASYGNVFAEFMLHELCHYYFSKSHRTDTTHDYILPYSNMVNGRVLYYEFLLNSMKDYWGSASPVFDPVIRLGSIGEPVKTLQNLLGGLVPDGHFGPKTFAAVKAFQVLHGLVADGVVGPKTWSELKKNPKSLISAIIQVESSGDDNAVGDKGLQYPAYGCMQIRQPLVDDVNKKFGSNYKSTDCLGNRELSVELFNKYFDVYPELKTDEDKARAWNGGAGWKSVYKKKGYEKYSQNLDDYWNKVRKLL